MLARQWIACFSAIHIPKHGYKHSKSDNNFTTVPGETVFYDNV